MMPGQSIKREVGASIVVFLVALPLSLGIALASGAPLIAGLVAAATGGIIGGLAGGAPLLVSGPAAGLAVMVFDISTKHGFATVALVTAGAGLLQVLLGLGKVARFAMAIAPAVLHGMLAGIGILIAVSQCHVAMGQSPHSTLWQNLLGLVAAWQHVNLAALAVGVVTVAALLLWPRLPKRGWGVPPALVAVLLATALSQLLLLDVPHVSLPETWKWQPPVLPRANLAVIMANVVAIALIASTESLLCAVALDKLHTGPRANLDRELIGQGLSNTVSGLLGGLPVTGVVVRSTANIEAGARTRWSSVLHGFWVVVAVGLCGGALSRIPLSALAALLVVVGVRLVKWRDLRELHGQGESAVYLITVAGVIGINLLAGIGLGLLASAGRLFWQLTRARIDLQERDGAHVVTVRGAATFLLVPQLTQELSKIPAGAVARVELNAPIIDHAAREALHNFGVAHQATGGQFETQWGQGLP